MKTYGQYCPVARAADILNQKWTLLIMRDILGGARRFNAIRKGVPRMSPTLLSQRLKSLEGYGLIEHRQMPDKAAAEYHPTPAGIELQPIIDLYGVWGQRWVRNKLGEDELDVGMLMWYLRLGIDRGRFPHGKSVIHFEYSDRPRLSNGNWWVDKWWLIVADDGIDLCVDDPGFEVDLYVLTDLRTMTKISLGDIAVPEALRSGAIELHGAKALAESFDAWLPRSNFAGVARPPEPLDLPQILTSLRVEAAE
jgi:DNA-binding HxlR family transcriptional regulator